MNTPTRRRIVIVGAGTAGAAAAALLARTGVVDVTCMDRRPLHLAGAQWCNGVPMAAFDEARLPRPVAPELRVSQHFYLYGGWGPDRVRLVSDGHGDVDMRRYTQRLHTIAREHGADLHGETRARSLHGNVLQTSGGAFEFDVLVDASGLKGAGLMPRRTRKRTTLCTAAQVVFDVADPSGAQAWLQRHNLDWGDIACFTGVSGGYSIVNVRVHHDHVAVLTGSIPALGHTSGRALLEDWVARHPWVGPKQFGGARAIPIGFPDPNPVAGNVIALGDAAGHVFAPHGSGIAVQLRAARILTRVLAGTPQSTVHDVAAAWRAELLPELNRGALLARATTGLTASHIQRWIQTGALNGITAGHTVRQARGLPPLTGLLQTLVGVAKAPRVLAPLLRGLWN
ncbi:MAG: NAD(P)-binding protein [Myxococcota bacterium]